jgi:hypothetical protein
MLAILSGQVAMDITWPVEWPCWRAKELDYDLPGGMAMQVSARLGRRGCQGWCHHPSGLHRLGSTAHHSVFTTLRQPLPSMFIFCPQLQGMQQPQR